jgi:hypothetical protein
MDSDIALILFLGLCLVGVAVVGVLIVFTPILSWLLVAGVALLGIRFLLTFLGLTGATPDRPRLLTENLVSKMTISLTTEVGQAGPERFAINARGVITNHSDRTITGITVWCRAEALYGSDTDSGTIPVTVRPGETRSFSGEVADRFHGIAERGTVLRVAPKRHFCRVAGVVEG